MPREKTWRSGPPSLSPGVEALSLLYNVEKKSVVQIAKTYGVATVTASRWMKNAGIERRSISESTSLAQTGRPLSERHKESVRKNAAIARTHITDESRDKHRQKMLGRTAPNKGTKWTPEQRATHMEIRRSPEYRQKLSDSLSGDKNYMWNGGSDRQRRDWKWRERARECYERDGWLCRRCGVHCTSKGATRIQAHHLLPKRRGGSDELENLVTLCVTCHAAAERLFKRRGPSGTKPTALATHKKRSKHGLDTD